MQSLAETQRLTGNDEEYSDPVLDTEVDVLDEMFDEVNDD